MFAPLLIPARYKGAYGGRGSGKSRFFADRLIERCENEPGLRAICIREVQISLMQSVKRLLEDRIRALHLDNFIIKGTHIETPGGGTIHFQGMQSHTAESIKSLEGYKIAWVEEAQSLSRRSLDLLRPTIRLPDSELWFSWNPRSPKEPVDMLFRSDPPPDAVSVKVNYDDNPYFPDVLRDDMEYDKRRDPDRYLHVWRGAYQQHSEARVFRNYRVGAEDEFIEPDRPYYGADWGFSVDPSVLIRCYIKGRTLFIDRESYAVGCEIDRLPALFDQCDDGKARKWTIRADSSRPDTISYLKRFGYPKIVPATKGKGSVEEGVEFLKSYDIVIHPACKHTIDEFEMYSYKIDKLSEEVLPVLEDAKNHVIDSCRYALEEVRLGSKYDDLLRLVK